MGNMAAVKPRITRVVAAGYSTSAFDARVTAVAGLSDTELTYVAPSFVAAAAGFAGHGVVDALLPGGGAVNEFEASRMDFRGLVSEEVRDASGRAG